MLLLWKVFYSDIIFQQTPMAPESPISVLSLASEIIFD